MHVITSLRALLLAGLCGLLTGTAHAFTLVNASAHSVSLVLAWCAIDADTQEMALLRFDKQIKLGAQSSQELLLDREYEQVWVTIVYEDGTQEEPFRMLVEPYEPDKNIDTTCRLVITDVSSDELKFKLQGKKFVEMARKAALLREVKRQQALLAAAGNTADNKINS